MADIIKSLLSFFKIYLADVEMVFLPAQRPGYWISYHITINTQNIY
jgi:hypothetical protein